MQKLNRYEEAIRAVPADSPFKGAVIDVCDTAYMAREWFHAHGYQSATAADVVAMARLIIEREAALKAAQGIPDDL